VQPGDSLNPNGELGEIVNFAQLQMVVGIDELDIPKVALDQEAQILVEALPDAAFTGKVVSIADEGTASNGVASFDVTIVLADADNLKVGMSAEASIMTAKKTDALYVPVEAVQSSQGKYYVMVPAATGDAPSSATQGGQRNQSGQTGQVGQTGTTGQTGQTGQGTQGQARGGIQGGQAPNGNAGRFQNMTDEERAALREQFAASRGNGSAGGNTVRGNAARGASVTSTSRVEVEVGINNEDNIEIVSGLKEGESVVLPTVVSSNSNANPQSGFPGLGGGFTGGGGFAGGGGFTGGNGGGRQFSGGGRAGGGN
jgi:HlyD family secretion protein